MLSGMSDFMGKPNSIIGWFGYAKGSSDGNINVSSLCTGLCTLSCCAAYGCLCELVAVLVVDSGVALCMSMDMKSLNAADIVMSGKPWLDGAGIVSTELRVIGVLKVLLVN